MARNSGQNKARDEETVWDQEIWLAIRYLDPEMKGEASDNSVADCEIKVHHSKTVQTRNEPAKRQAYYFRRGILGHHAPSP